MGPIGKTNKKITLTTLHEWKKELQWQDIFSCNPQNEKSHFYKMETSQDALKLIFHIPAKTNRFLEYVLLYDKKEMVILTKTKSEEKLTCLLKEMIGELPLI